MKSKTAVVYREQDDGTEREIEVTDILDPVDPSVTLTAEEREDAAVQFDELRCERGERAPNRDEVEREAAGGRRGEAWL